MKFDREKYCIFAFLPGGESKIVCDLRTNPVFIGTNNSIFILLYFFLLNNCLVDEDYFLAVDDVNDDSTSDERDDVIIDGSGSGGMCCQKSLPAYLTLNCYYFRNREIKVNIYLF